jgi:hypothetical protein
MFYLARRRLLASGRDPGNVVFGIIGWLFADLMFALAMTYLVATTVGQPPRPKPTPSASPSPSPSASPSPSREPVLELNPVNIVLNSVDWRGLLDNNPAAADAMLGQVKANGQLAGRRAGLVLTFGGASPGDTDLALRIAGRVNDLLKQLGEQTGFVFRGTIYRPFLSLASPYSKVTIEVYLFKL